MKFYSTINYFNSRASIIFLILLLIIGNHQSCAQVTWAPIGPGGGGWLTAITVVDDSQNTVYVGCDVGGIYKSTNHGESWEIKDQGLSIYFVHDIAYDPQSPEILYLATRGGVYKSLNGGDSWQAKRSGFPLVNDYHFSAPISDILIDPNSPNIIYAGIGVPNTGYDLNSFHWQSVETKGAIYKSTDNGEEWELIRNTGIDTTAMIFSLALDHNNSNILYAATSEGIYKSLDAGLSWTPKNTGLPQPLCMKLVVDPEQTNILYVTLWAEPGSLTWQGGVYKSIDGGENWSVKNNGLPQEIGDVSGMTCNYPALVMDEQNPQILYTGNIPWTPDPGVYKTTDGGENWAWVSRPDPPDENMDLGWISEAEVSAVCIGIDPNNSNSLYFGTSMYLFKTENGGEFWDQAYTRPMGNNYWQGNGFETTVAYTIAVDPTNSDNIYAGYWDIGMFKSQDGGSTFKEATNGMNYNANTFDITIDPANPAIIYATGGWWEENQGEVYKSTDNAENWSVINNGMPDAQVWSIALDKNSSVDSRTLYATSYHNGVYKTTDGGQNWLPINNGLGVDNNLQLRKIIIDPNNSNVLYAGIEAKVIEDGDEITTIQGGLFKSVDAGENWTRIDSDSPQLSVWDIDIDPMDSQIIYTSVSSEYDHSLQIDYHGGVYKTTDGGLTWEMANNGFGSLENLDVSSIAISPANHQTLYATTTDSPYHDECNGRGIFKSTDSGNTWQAVNSGLGVHYFSTITIDPSNSSILYAGSSGNGIDKGIDSEVSGSVELDSDSDLERIFNSPNPFSSSTDINFQLSIDSRITLNIFDIHGRLIRTLLSNENYLAGKHSIVWNGLNNSCELAASGTYFYSISSDNHFIRGKMILRH